MQPDDCDTFVWRLMLSDTRELRSWCLAFFRSRFFVMRNSFCQFRRVIYLKIKCISTLTGRKDKCCQSGSASGRSWRQLPRCWTTDPLNSGMHFSFRASFSSTPSFRASYRRHSRRPRPSVRPSARNGLYVQVVRLFFNNHFSTLLKWIYSTRKLLDILTKSAT